jgi:hypothetical protein
MPRTYAYRRKPGRDEQSAKSTRLPILLWVKLAIRRLHLAWK